MLRQEIAAAAGANFCEGGNWAFGVRKNGIRMICGVRGGGGGAGRRGGPRDVENEEFSDLGPHGTCFAAVRFGEDAVFAFKAYYFSGGGIEMSFLVVFGFSKMIKLV